MQYKILITSRDTFLACNNQLTATEQNVNANANNALSIELFARKTKNHASNPKQQLIHINRLVQLVRIIIIFILY